MPVCCSRNGSPWSRGGWGSRRGPARRGRCCIGSSSRRFCRGWHREIGKSVSSCNLLVRKADLVAWGGFDEGMGMAEDLMLCRKLRRRGGGRPYFEGATGVWHPNDATWVGAKAHLRRLGYWSGRFRDFGGGSRIVVAALPGAEPGASRCGGCRGSWGVCSWWTTAWRGSGPWCGSPGWRRGWRSGRGDSTGECGRRGGGRPVDPQSKVRWSSAWPGWKALRTRAGTTSWGQAAGRPDTAVVDKVHCGTSFDHM